MKDFGIRYKTEKAEHQRQVEILTRMANFWVDERLREIARTDDPLAPIARAILLTYPDFEAQNAA